MEGGYKNKSRNNPNEEWCNTNTISITKERGRKMLKGNREGKLLERALLRKEEKNKTKRRGYLINTTPGPQLGHEMNQAKSWGETSQDFFLFFPLSRCVKHWEGELGKKQIALIEWECKQVLRTGQWASLSKMGTRNKIRLLLLPWVGMRVTTLHSCSQKGWLKYQVLVNSFLKKKKGRT